MAARRGILELREYALKVQHAAKYVDATRNAAGLRKGLFPLRLFSLPETGGKLHVATHLYAYESMEAREQARASAMGEKGWGEYLGTVRPLVETQQSNIYVEAPLVDKFGLHGFAPGDSGALAVEGEGNCIYEFRKYQLKLGYDTVPKFMEFYEAGLPSKLRTTDPTTSLVSLFSTEVGTLNEVFEIWRHGNGVTSMEISRANAREAGDWRKAIGGIAELAVSFQSTVHKPLDFSNYQ